MSTWGERSKCPVPFLSPVAESILHSRWVNEPKIWGSCFTPNLSHSRPGRCLPCVLNLSRTRFLILTFVVFRFSISRGDRRTFIITSRLIKSGSFQASFSIPLLSCKYLRLKLQCWDTSTMLLQAFKFTFYCNLATVVLLNFFSFLLGNFGFSSSISSSSKFTCSLLRITGLTSSLALSFLTSTGVSSFSSYVSSSAEISGTLDKPFFPQQRQVVLQYLDPH
ncbi:hypothetical protein TNIN_261521 [Trichonephila inaurata madagascariensis]|uniref:Uncharacterized protein n=1 Tax=Trichonephila inaurata madagascariensis TaxID=2747483 RepID=A0A8X7BVV3_9ARAC|nr:hypothetical protein TNIN_261521 [Trichonephila inaurata madagascariensis]